MRFPTAPPDSATEQVEVAVPGTSVQEADGVNESPAAVEEKDTVPAGLPFVPAASTSVTLTVTVPAWPARSGLGETETAVVVERVLTLRAALPPLAWKTPETPA